MTDLLKCSKTEGGEIVTPQFRLLYPNVYKTEIGMKKEDTGKYSIKMCFIDEVDLSVLRKEIKLCADEYYKDGMPKDATYPIKEGKFKAGKAGYDGATWTMGAKTQYTFSVMDAKNENEITEDDGLVYPGAIFRALVQPYGYTYMGKTGITLGLRGLQFVKHGTKIAGGTQAQDAFSVVDTPDNSYGDDEGFDSRGVPESAKESSNPW